MAVPVLAASQNSFGHAVNVLRAKPSGWIPRSVSCFNLALFAVVLAATLGGIVYYMVFPFYIAATLFCLKYARGFPIVFLLKIVMAIVLMYFHSEDMGSIINISSLLAADLFGIVLGATLSRMQFDMAIHMLYRLGIVCFWATFLATIAGVYLVGFVNPVSALVSGGRVLFLSYPGDGHSILNEISAMALICILSGGARVRSVIFSSIIFSMLLFIGGSATSALCLLVIWGAYFLERGVIFTKLKNILHLTAIIATIFSALNQDILNSAMQIIRVEIVGQNEENYYGDFSAGRTMLNSLLIDTANDAPIFGVGHDHPVLLYGVRLITGKETGAKSESPLRIAAKYGWIFFSLSAIIALMPIASGLLSRDGKRRKFFLMSGYAIMILGGTNAGFSVAQSSLYLLFGPILWFSWYSLYDQLRSNRHGLFTPIVHAKALS